MKKIDLMLKLLFAVLFVNVSFGQGVYPGGATCATAVPITVGNGYSTPPGSCGPTEWYSFVAPCNGSLTVCTGGPNEVDKRINTGVCGSLTLAASATWSTTCTPAVTLTEGQTVYIEILDSWDCVGQFDIRFLNPACPQPTALSSAALAWDEAIVAWFPGGSETEWTIVYGVSGFDPETEGTSIVVDASFWTLTGLEELTCYDWYVQANCAGGEVSCFLSGPNTFCTPAVCPAPLAPNESGVTNTETTLNWSPGAAETAWEIEWGGEGFEIGDGTEDTWAFAGGYALAGLEPDSCYDWYVRAECLVDLGAGPEIVYSLWVGPNEWCTEANCVAPSGGTMVASGGLSATLAWTINNSPAETEWNIQYGAPGFSLGAGTTVTNIPTNPFTLTGLEPGTDYCYYVQAVCGEGPDSLSSWAGPYCFTTGIFCEEPSGLFAEATSGTEASLDWDAGDAETAWTVSWGVSPLADPMDGAMESAAVFPALGLTGLTPGETYCYYVRADCGDADPDSSSTWAGPFCWMQPALCATPFSVEAISVTNTAAFINFSAPGGETYDLQWGLPCFEVESGDEVGMVAGSPDKPYYITGLDESTPYWVYVRSICGVDSVSTWAGPVLFGTQVGNDDPCDAETLVLDGPSLLRHNFDATILPGEAAIAPAGAGCTDTDGWCSGEGIEKSVWFKFDAPASGQVKVSTFDESECITNGYTEIAIYSTGACDIISNFVVEYANTLDEAALGAPYGSTITACGLTPGETYYVLVNPLSYIQPNVHFGIALSSIEEVSAGLGLSPTICAGSDYDLFDAIAGYSTEDGTWYNPTVAPGNELPSLVSFPDVVGSFDLYYVVGNGCDADTVMTVVTTAEGVHAGGDGFYTACNSYDIVLSDHLVGAYDGGGIWMYDGVAPDVALAGGLFAPLGMPAGVYKFLYTVANEYCPTDSAYVTVTLTDCSGIDENAENALVVYPNPVVDVLTVSNVAIEGNAVIEVLDIEGRVIISKNVSNLFGNYTIDMSSIESGVYFVKVTADNSVQKVRVVKQ